MMTIFKPWPNMFPTCGWSHLCHVWVTSCLRWVASETMKNNQLMLELLQTSKPQWEGSSPFLCWTHGFVAASLPSSLKNLTLAFFCLLCRCQRSPLTRARWQPLVWCMYIAYWGGLPFCERQYGWSWCNTWCIPYDIKLHFICIGILGLDMDSASKTCRVRTRQVVTEQPFF